MDWLTEEVIVQTIITLGLILVAVIPAYFKFKAELAPIGKDAREAREQVKNSHDTNLREEADERHLEVLREMKESAKYIRGLRDDLHATRQDLGQVHGSLRVIRKDILGLRADDAQGRSALSEAVKERDQELARIRSDIPRIIRDELTKADFSDPKL